MLFILHSLGCTLSGFYSKVQFALLVMVGLTWFTAYSQSSDKEIFQSTITNPDTRLLQLKNKYNQAFDKQDFVLAAQLLQQMGQLCYHYGHYPQALEFHLQANNLFKNQHQTELLAYNLNDLGLLYYYNRNLKLAKLQYDEALHIFQNKHNDLGLAHTFGKIGHLYEKQEKYDSALYFQRKAINYYKKIDNQTGIAKIYENLGSIFEDLAQYDSAHYYFSQSLKINQVTHDQLAQIEVLNNLGDVLRKTGAIKQGLTYSKEALKLAQKLHEKYQEASAYRDIARALNMLGRNDSAYYYLEVSRKMTLDIYSEKSNQQIAVLQVMYDIAKKNNEIERLDNISRTNQILGISGVIVIALLIILGFVAINRQKMKIKNQHYINEQKQKVFEKEQDLMAAALKNKQLEEENLKNLLETKTKELSTHTLHVIQKNQLLEKLYQRLEKIVKDDRKNSQRNLRQIMQDINQSFDHDQYWEDFRNIFDQVHQSFLTKLKNHSEQLTANDLRLIALLKMNLNSNDIASILGISPDSLRVIRYRLRKKLNLPQGENLSTFIQSL